MHVMESVQGNLGQIDGTEELTGRSYGTSFEDEPPLLEELGIDFQLIKQKVLDSFALPVEISLLVCFAFRLCQC